MAGMILAASGGYDIDNNHLYIVLQRNKKPREFSRPHSFLRYGDYRFTP